MLKQFKSKYFIAFKKGIIASAISLLPTTHGFATSTDPCDFTTGEDLFNWRQVMQCYRSVPFQPEDLQVIVDTIRNTRESSPLAELENERISWQANLDELLYLNPLFNPISPINSFNFFTLINQSTQSSSFRPSSKRSGLPSSLIPRPSQSFPQTPQ